MSNLPPYDPNSMPPLPPGATTSYPGYYNPMQSAPPARPGLIVAVAVIAIIFGALGVLCDGISLLGSVAAGTMQLKTPHATGGALVAQGVLQAVGLGFWIVWLVIGITLLMRKSWALAMLNGLSLADIAFGIVKLVVTVVAIVPTFVQQQQILAASGSANLPPGYSTGYVAGAYGAPVLIFFVTLVVPIMAMIAAKRDDVKASFASGG